MKNPLATLPTSVLGWIAVAFLLGATSAIGMRVASSVWPGPLVEQNRVLRIADLGRLCELVMIAYTKSDELAPAWYDAAAADIKNCGVQLEHEPNSRGSMP